MKSNLARKSWSSGSQFAFALVVTLAGTCVLSAAGGCRAVAGDATNTDGGASSGLLPDGGDGGPASRNEPPVVHLDPGVIKVETLAGADKSGSTDGTGGAALFDNPVGVALDGSGGLFVTEYDGGRIRKIRADGSTVTLTTDLGQPFGLVVARDALYVQTDKDPAGIKNVNTGTIWKVPLTGGVATPVLQHLGSPRGLALLPDGRIIVSDRTRSTLTILNPADLSLTLLAGSAPGFADGRGAAAAFNNPYGVTVLPDGSLLVADYGNHCIRKVSLEGDVTLFAGDRNPGMKDDPDKMVARFDSPKDMAIDLLGNVYVSDTGNHRIRRIAPTGEVETVAGNGTAGFVDGPGTNAEFYGQEQIDVSDDGKTLFVSDGNVGDFSAFNRVRRITVP